MSINRMEILLRAAFLAATVVGGIGCAPKPVATPIKPAIATGQSASLLETPTPKVIPEAPPLVVSNLRASSFFQRFRGSLPEEASITYFGLHGYAGIVVPEEGVKIRILPDVNSEPAKVKWLDWGEQVGFQFWVTFRGKDQQLLERWILIDEKERPGTRWKCADGWHPGYGHCFAAMQIKDEVLIDFSNVTPPPADEVKFYPWPAPK